MKFIPAFLLLLFVPLPGIAQELEDEEGIVRVAVDTAPAFVRTWRMAEDFTVMQDYDMDTMQTGFQKFSPVEKTSISQAFLGNIGLQTRDNIYFNRGNYPEFFFLRPFSPYLYTPEKNVFYNITKPFTILEYFTTTGDRLKRGELFHATHTQNITPYLNMGFDIRLLSSEGAYLHQKSKFNSFSFFESYTGNDYSVLTSFHVNTQSAQENGGIRNDSIFMNSNKDERAYEVNLNNATSRMRNLDFHLTQRYKFGKADVIPDTTNETGFRRLRERTTKTGSFIHSIEYQRDYRIFEDKITSSNVDFYPNYFISPSKTYDSTYFRSLSNTFQVMLDENPNRANDFGARAFIKHDWVKYAYNTPNDSSFTGSDTLVEDHKEYQYQNVQIGASVLHTVGVGWDWSVRGRYYLFGYKASDLILDGYITRRFKGRRGESMISISGKFAIEEPDHFLKFYQSNNYIWNNDFKKIKDIRGSLTIRNEALKILARINLSLISDLVYFDNSAMPVQSPSVVSVMSGELRKNFKLGILHSNHEIHYQLSSDNNLIRIPDLSYYTSDFIGFTVVKDALYAEIGFDFSYYTKYRALAFAPSSGVFYNQDVREIGNYPYLNLFLNAKIKRTRFFFRWDNPYAGEIAKNYFHVLNYPTRGRVVKLGLSWTFYN